MAEAFFRGSRIDTADELYLCSVCGQQHLLHDVSITLSKADDEYYARLIDELFAGRNNDEVIATDRTTLVKTVTQLTRGIEEGYGKKLSEVDYSTPDDGMLKAMEKNVYEFAAAKNYQQMKALNEALRDGKRLKSFEEFKRDASAIIDEYQVRYLKAEYNHAVAASQMCRKWQDFPPGALLQ